MVEHQLVIILVCLLFSIHNQHPYVAKQLCDTVTNYIMCKPSFCVCDAMIGYCHLWTLLKEYRSTRKGMKYKRNRHGAVGKSSLEQHFINLPPLPLLCEISGGSRCHMISYQSLLLSTTVLNDSDECPYLLLSLYSSSC